MKKCYHAGATRLTMRTGSGTGTSGLNWLFGDRLGSTSRSANFDGASTALQLYKAWGESRYASGTLPTSYKFTGQRLESSLGIYDYGARWYDPYLNRWLQPDFIIPETYNPQDWDRYSYTRNNPNTYIDPSGHSPELPDIFASILSIGATSLDITALGLSTAGTILEGVAAAGVEISTPVPGLDGALGLIGGIEAYNKLINPIENALSLISAAMVATADIITEQTHFETVDLGMLGGQSTELVFGPDTTFSLASITVGNTSLTPEAATDTMANLATVYYDTARLADKEPVWGLYEFRIGHKQDTDLFHGWYTRFGPKKTESEDN